MTVRVELRPACWSWPVPPLRNLTEEVNWLTGRQLELPPDERVDRECLEDMYTDPLSLRFAEFHTGERGGLEFARLRCAICGAARRRMVADHDHATGMIRGWLCRACNTGEGRRVDPTETMVFDAYRRWHPAAILGVYMPYTGFGWINGWPPGQASPGAEPRTSTPWPSPPEQY
jgi:hypothetical protein